jgi:hypothetical protein
MIKTNGKIIMGYNNDNYFYVVIDCNESPFSTNEYTFIRLFEEPAFNFKKDLINIFYDGNKKPFIQIELLFV